MTLLSKYLTLPLLACAVVANAQTPNESLPKDVQLRPNKDVTTVTPDKSKEVTNPNAPAKLTGMPVLNRVAASVNGKPITTNEVSFLLYTVYQQLATVYPSQGPEFTRQLAIAKEAILNDLIDRELVLNDFEKSGRQIPEYLIDQRINHIIMSTFNGNRDLFLENLRRSNMTIRGHREITERNVKIEGMRQMKYDDGIPPTPDEIKKEYAKIKHDLRDITQDQVQFKKIFIPAYSADLSVQPEEQLALAKIVVEELNKDPKQFEEFAKRYSEDMNATDGGQAPMVKRSSLSPEVSTVIFDSEIGKIVGPLISPQGFTILVVQKKQYAPAPPLSKVKEQVDTHVRMKRSSERYKKWVNQLRERAIIHKYI